MTKLSQLWEQRINWAWFSEFVYVVCYHFCSYVITCSIVWVKMGDYIRIYYFKFSFEAVLLDCSIVKVSTMRWQNYICVFAGVKSQWFLQLGWKACLYKKPHPRISPAIRQLELRKTSLHFVFNLVGVLNHFRDWLSITSNVENLFSYLFFFWNPFKAVKVEEICVKKEKKKKERKRSWNFLWFTVVNPTSDNAWSLKIVLSFWRCHHPFLSFFHLKKCRKPLFFIW